MKKTALLLLFSILLCSCSNKEKDALTWHNNLVEIQDKSYDALDNIRILLEGQNYEDAERKLPEASKLNKDNIAALTSMETSEEGKPLKEASLKVLSSYQAVFDAIPEIIKTMRDTSISEEKVNETIKRFDTLVADVDQNTIIMEAAQKTFLTKFNLKLASDSSAADTKK